MNPRQKTWKEWSDAVLYSYSQVFFIRHRPAAILILLTTFFVPALGFWGLTAVVITHALAMLMGFDRKHLQDGLLGLNSILSAMALASYFEAGLPFFIVLLALCMLTLLLAIGSLHWLGSRGLPFLSIPFLISTWTILLAIRGFTAITPNPGNIYFLNDLFAIGGRTLVDWYVILNDIPIPTFILGYFKSLSAIIFQYNWVAGLAIACALLMSSRIAFLLSLLGYLSGYLFYIVVGATMTPLYYSYIGFNFILLAIALGGFFFIPSWKSFLMVALLMPVLALLVSGTSAVLYPMQLPVFSLPFVVLVLVMIYASYFTTRAHLVKPAIQHFLPETNLYAYQTYQKRFGRATLVALAPPFLGEWTVVQGHEGKHTHKGPWKHAWDFAVKDTSGNTFRGDGLALEQYHAYNLPMLAPADARVVEILDHVPDNQPGEVNLKENWGNVIILEHAPGLYSKLSHLKAGSFKVSRGDLVGRGDILALLGNSGRSPEPHLHFQVQATPDIGSPTLKYPFAWYLREDEKGLVLHTYDIPRSGQKIQTITAAPWLLQAIDWKPGKILSFETRIGQEAILKDVFIIRVDTLNKTYLECKQYHARAYFELNGPMLYFYGYHGSKRSRLYHIYLSLYRLVLSTRAGINIADAIPLDHYLPARQRVWQDMLSPFHVYHNIIYKHQLMGEVSEFEAEQVQYKSVIESIRLGKTRSSLSYQIILDKFGIQEISTIDKDIKIQITRDANPEQYLESVAW